MIDFFFLRKILWKIEDWLSPIFYFLVFFFILLSICFCYVLIEHCLFDDNVFRYDFLSIVKMVLIDLKDTFIFIGGLKILFS